MTEFESTGPEPQKPKLIFWEFTYRPTSSYYAGKIYYARAGNEEAAREFCRWYGHEYIGGSWELVEG